MKCICGKYPCQECGHCNCPEWISVKDRLPKLIEGDVHSQDVLTYCISDGLTRHQDFMNTYPKDESYMSIDTIVKWNDMEPSFRADRFFGKVTHWMPLPKPPKE